MEKAHIENTKPRRSEQSPKAATSSRLLPPPRRTTATTATMAASSPSHRSLLLAVLAVATLSLCFGAAVAAQAGSGEGYTIAGRIKIDGASSKGFGLPAKTSNTKVILNGGQRVTFARPDGYFSFIADHTILPFLLLLDLIYFSHNVPAGTHLIEVSSIGYFFSPVRVDISARNPGYIQAALTETRRVLNELVLEPLKEEQYYEAREPFSIMSLLKSPMGLMVGFMVIMVFVMPKMMENIDPEEMRQAQEQMRNSPVSFSNLLARTQG
ncbi:hypothetical protein EJB05_41674 [Eragrostis curvula]|uniref:ER membrane protein complex subunit 7 beta-sandwich domain-containing protein n=1 Tax=Eragrostis curvula TaxID=38414 RepID=A0A5J9TA83_9POAL|nr:hypothetical protein EJB05_41674 [Eragrostis curvula]